MLVLSMNMLWFVVFSIAMIRHRCLAVKKASLTIIDYESFSYRAELWDLGSSLEGSWTYAASLMIPPGDMQLCGFPPSLVNEINGTTVQIERASQVGLLVSLGGCEPYEKALAALEIQEKVASTLKYIIFYNNNPNTPEDIATYVDSGDEGNYNFDSLAFISVSTQAGTSIMSRMAELSNVNDQNFTFFGDGKKGYLPMVLDLTPDAPIDRPNNTYGESKMPSGSFYWFRFVLFTLLIVSPCCRTGYLWWAGGGRIRLRRNEEGRIIGLQYIPPMDYWFASHAAHDNAPQTTSRLTEEEVLALPEITFKPEVDTEGDNSESENGAQRLEDVDIVVNPGSPDLRKQESMSNGSGIMNALEEQPANNDENNGTSDAAPVNYKTTCTTCSICIDEFEADERIRLLPRCQHAFHTDCIMPWLTERQGCCPLCKSSVLEPEGGEEEEGVTREQGDDASLDSESSSSELSGDESDAEIPSQVPITITNPDIVVEAVPDLQENENATGSSSQDVSQVVTPSEGADVPSP